MFKITNLQAGIEEKQILQGLSLEILPGEVHVIMGPNGSGKSTLANCIMGHPGYQVTGGSIQLDGEEVNELKADKRAQRGLFLAFQYPKEIPGVGVNNFLKSAVASVRKARGEKELSHIEFRKLLRE
ncbi:Fe-S cluster assembly ATPase SufC, partial [Candidatus Peregrinibacteria bacterium CG11_big_fil_rev_8_21_14_0_20_46_8]